MSKRQIILNILFISFSSLTIPFLANAQNVEWSVSASTSSWTEKNKISRESSNGIPDAEVFTDKPLQIINGFGGCFNELGYTALQLLSIKDRDAIMRELFAPGVGANFTICRMPIGANDFSLDWYSYDEYPGDFALDHFSIDHDKNTLIPYIKEAQKYNPLLALWASPWSPPQWLKKNNHYAARMVPSKEIAEKYKYAGIDMTNVTNGLKQGQEGSEGSDMFIQEDKYFTTYSKYFGKFIDAYKRHGIKIGMVMPQNEFNSAQIFPSCTWTAHGLNCFISYLGPEMKKRGVKVFLGTYERSNEKLADTILTNSESKKFIEGIGFQWAGKGAIVGIHKRYPNLTLYQSEQECGDGENDWKYCAYTWDLMKLYFKNGANAYMYWNIALKDGGISHWGWHQNSLVSVDTVSKTYKFNYEYYLLKHLSHYVMPGARLLKTGGEFNDLLAFKNPDDSIVLIIHNEEKTERKITIKVNDKTVSPVLEADSFNTLVIR